MTRDRKIFERFIRALDREASETSPGHLVLKTASFFLGRPYRAGTLEAKGREHLVINLREFDCFTFVENVVALAWWVERRFQNSRGCRSRSPDGVASQQKITRSTTVGVKCTEESFEAFKGLLKKIRYRQGRLQGYSSRLHYFSDWICDNQKKGILKDMTAEIGGIHLEKGIGFMTAHRERYPRLKDRKTLLAMRSLERRISRRVLSFIPKNHLRRVERRIRDGDVIAIVTNREGLDVQHAGLAVRVKDRIHLIHASSTEGKVVVSRENLQRYLAQSVDRAGILVGRVGFPSPGKSPGHQRASSPRTDMNMKGPFFGGRQGNI